MKILRHIILLFSIAGSGYLILPIAYDSAVLFLHEHSNEALVRAHLRFIPDERYNSELRDALLQDDIELANQIYVVGQEQSVAFKAALVKQLEDENSLGSKLSRSATDFWGGAWNEEIKSEAGFVGAFVGDLTAIGDVRDLTTEFQKYPDYDSLTVGLSIVGIAATALTVSSVLNGGTTATIGAPLRLGVTSVKMTRKTGKISKKLEALVSKHADGVIDKKVVDKLAIKVKSLELDNLDKRQFDEIASISKNAINPKAMEPLRSAFNDMHSIQSHSGYGGLARSLAVSDDFKDLGRLKKVSVITKSKMTGVIKLAPRLAKPFMNVLEIIYQAIAFLCSALIWVLWLIWYLFKAIRLIF